VISCSEAVEQLWAYLDREIPTRDAEAVEQHLAFCRRCCGEVEFAQELRGMLASAAHVEALPAEVEAQLNRVLDELDQDGSPPPHQGVLSQDGDTP
jgi:mycothiol system anti-sigma-R factor